MSRTFVGFRSSAFVGRYNSVKHVVLVLFAIALFAALLCSSVIMRLIDYLSRRNLFAYSEYCVV